MAKAFDCPDCGHAVSKKAYERPSRGRQLKKSPGARLAQGCPGFVGPWLAILFIV
jgi:hypothetical protein